MTKWCKDATKNQPSDPKEEHGEFKFDDSDCNLDTLPGDCSDGSDATCICSEGISSVDTTWETWV